MLLRKIRSLRHRLSFRLTLWYAGIFTVTSVVAFCYFYFLIISISRERTDQDLLQRIDEFSVMLSLYGMDALQRNAVMEAQAAGEKKLFIRLIYPTGVAFSSSNMTYWRDITVDRPAIQQILAGTDPVFHTVRIPQRKHKVRVVYSAIGSGIILQLGYSMEADTRIIEAFRRMFVGTMVLMMLMAALIGWFMARRALTGVEAVTRTARQISEGDLTRRVPSTASGDEVDQLAVTFNQMLDRIQQLVRGIREMSDNIAHDLKSPITRIRGLAELTLSGAPSIDAYRRSAGDTIEACDRLLEMINTMLVISQAEAGAGRLNLETLDVAAVIRAACELFLPIAEDKGLVLNCNVSGSMEIPADPPLFQRMVANILDNAIKYTPSSGSVTVSVHGDASGRQGISIRVEDTGIGIAEDELPKIFQRFYRCDRSRTQEGTGLGLSLARAIARAHGGDIAVISTPGQGSRFTITLPASPIPA